MSTLTKEAIDSFIATVKGIPTTFAPKDSRKTVKDVKPDGKGANGLYTSKDKAVLGVDESHAITWSAFHLSSADSNQFRVFAEKVIGRPSFELAADILNVWFEKNREQIEASTTEFMREEKTAEDVEKLIAKKQKELENAMNLLKSMKG